MDSRPLLLRNDSPRRGHWAKFRVLNRHGSPAIHSRATLTAGGLTQRRELRSGSSHQSQNALEMLFGLGPATRIDRLEVRWPGGRRVVLRDLAVDRTTTIREPDGPTPPRPGAARGDPRPSGRERSQTAAGRRLNAGRASIK
jgi:hypothetical protein